MTKSIWEAGEGNVFVHVMTEDDYPWFEEVPAAQAAEKDIIKCALCKKPAVHLDTLYPAFSENNRCAEHDRRGS